MECRKGCKSLLLLEPLFPLPPLPRLMGSEFPGPQRPCFHLSLHLRTRLNAKVATSLSEKRANSFATCNIWQGHNPMGRVRWWLRKTDFSTSPATLDTSASLAPVPSSPKGVIGSRWSEGLLPELTFWLWSDLLWGVISCKILNFKHSPRFKSWSSDLLLILARHMPHHYVPRGICQSNLQNNKLQIMY